MSLASGSTLQLRADSNTTFTAASIGNLGNGTFNFNVDQVTSGGGNGGHTLTLGNNITQGAATSTINVTGGSNDTLGLGTFTGAGNAADAVFNVASGVGLSLSLAGATGGNDGFSFTGAGNTTIVAANLANSNSRSMTLNLNDTGTVTLSGPSFTVTGSSGTGNIVLNSGALVLGNTGALGSKFGNLTITGGSLDASVAIPTAASNPSQNWNGSFTFTGSNNLNLGTGAVTVGANSTLTASASTLTVGVITDIGGVTFTKAGAGTVSTPGLVLGTGSSGFSSTNGALTSTGTLSVANGAAGTINATSPGTISFTTFNRTTGGTVDFTGTLANISTTAVNTGAGILGGWATVNGDSDYALASGGAIGAYTGQTGLTSAGGGTQTTTNFSLATALTLASAVTSNSLKISDSGTTDSLDNGGNNITFNSQAGGLLYASGTPGSAYTITGTGVVGGGTASEFIVNTQQGTLTINSPVVSATATAGSLTKTGAGTLILNGLSSYTGATSLDAGTIKIGVAQSGATGALGSGAGALTMGSGTTLDLQGFADTVGTLTTTGTAATNSILTSSSAATLTIAGSSVLSTLTVNGAASLLVNGGGAGTLSTAAATLIAGTGSLGFQNQTGSLRDNNIVANLGSNGSLLFNGAAQFQTTSAVTLPSGNGLIINNAGNQWNYQATTSVAGPITGSGTLTLTNGFNPTITLTGDLSGFHGTLGLSGAGSGQAIQFTNTTTFSNDANWTLNTAAPTTATNAISYFAYTGTGSKTIILGSLSGSSNAGTGSGVGFAGYGVLTNNTASTTATWQIGGANLSTAFAGVIQNGTGTSALNKVGSASLTLTGVNTYTGGTAVNGGALLVNNTTGSGVGSGAVVVNNNGTLGGTGLLTVSSVTVNSGGNLAPGATVGATTGALTLTTTSGVTMNGTLAIALGTTGNNGTFVTNNGNLTVSGATLSLSGVTPVAGTVYDLVNYTGTLTAGATNEGFATINGPTGFSYSVVAGTTFGTDLELDVTVVPEPSTWTAGLLSLGVLGFHLRRKYRLAA